jgi:hypothetical protein
MAAMAETVYTHNLEKRGRVSAAAKIERWVRYLYPALCWSSSWRTVCRDDEASLQ